MASGRRNSRRSALAFVAAAAAASAAVRSLMCALHQEVSCYGLAAGTQRHLELYATARSTPRWTLRESQGIASLRSVLAPYQPHTCCKVESVEASTVSARFKLLFPET